MFRVINVAVVFTKKYQLQNDNPDKYPGHNVTKKFSPVAFLKKGKLLSGEHHMLKLCRFFFLSSLKN